MLTRRDKDILRAILTLTNAKVNAGVRKIGQLVTPPICHEQAAKDVRDLIERGLLIREPRTAGQGSQYRLTRETIAMLSFAGVTPRKPALEDAEAMVEAQPEKVPSCTEEPGTST